MADARRPRFMLVTDLDGTLYDPRDETHAALRRFNSTWEKYCAHDCRLVYSTGRSRVKYNQLRVRGVCASAVRLMASAETLLTHRGARGALHRAACRCCSRTCSSAAWAPRSSAAARPPRSRTRPGRRRAQRPV
jgi:hypothetical protein